MSTANVELQHRVIDAFNRRDLDAYLALADHDLELTPYEVWVQGGQPYLGHVGVQSWWEETFEVLPDLKAEVYEVRDLGDSYAEPLSGAFRCGGRSSLHLMFEKRRAAKAKTQTGRGTDRLGVGTPSGAVRPEEGRSPLAQEARDLRTMCACGHARRDHTGLQMEVNGRCLECDCEEFRRASETLESQEQMLERVRAALARVKYLQETGAALHGAQHPAGNGRRSWPSQ